MTARAWIVCGAALGGLGVVLGAFGAHGLEAYLAAPQQATYETAVRYQMYHAMALILVGILADRRPGKSLTVAAWCFFFGTLLFSGPLYGIALADMPRLGMIAPVGGALLIAGWAALVVAAVKQRY